MPHLATRKGPPPLAKIYWPFIGACVYNMKKLLSTFPLTFQKRTLLHLGLLDVKRLPTYDKVELENHTSCKRPFKKKYIKRNVFWKWLWDGIVRLPLETARDSRSDTATFAPWVRGPGEKTLGRKKRRFYARLVIFRRHFHIITIVLCVHFIPHYCIIVWQCQVLFWNTYLSICSEVPDQSRGS